jgi:hypothetical protein
MSGIPAVAWAALAAGLLATGIKALTELFLTRMKLAFARELLRTDDGRADPDAARMDLDAVGKFVTPPPIRSVRADPADVEKGTVGSGRNSGLPGELPVGEVTPDKTNQQP